MSYLNKAMLIGNLGKDPEVSTMQNGNKVAKLSIATSESWKDKQSGERKTKTEWHRVVIFNEHLVKVAEDYAKKGTKVYIEGQLQTRKWTDQDGAEKYVTEIVLQRFKGELTLLDSKADRTSEDNAAGTDASTASQSQEGAGASTYEPGVDLDDDIPF